MTKKTIKIISVIMILVISMFIMGCESKKEKFYRMNQTRINYYQRGNIEIINTSNEKEKLEIFKNSLKRDLPHLKEMEKVAKGDPELEAKMKKLWADYEYGKKTCAEMEKQLK